MEAVSAHAHTQTRTVVGRDGVRTNIRITLARVPASPYIVARSNDALIMSVWYASDPDGAPVRYTATVDVLGADRALSQTMDAQQDCRRRGVPEACLLLAHEVLGCAVYSSSNLETAWWLDTETPTSRATKVWERLVVSKRATYDTTVDRYVIP
jgi:hypothetical protein